ncbi:hypothetical protein H7171_00400 [Candidatus Saccharibacteria bacterium]|nr:hypothetical protein [Candidatus Saccharibacteria bacterium]
MAAAAETFNQLFDVPHLRLVTSEPPEPVINIPETIQDEFTRQRAAKFIGACALENIVAEGQEVLAVKPIESLYDALQQAHCGDATARKMVEINVATDVIERTIKTGHVTTVDLDIDAAGKIQQFGQSMESVQANSLRYAANSWQIRQRTEAETVNAFRIESEYRQGTLEDYSFVVVSRAADNMTETQMSKAGFFTETMSCAIQVTSAQGDHLVTESAFVAGIKSPGGERHDSQTVATMFANLGVDIAAKSAAEIIGTPLLIHNDLMPNGVIDIVRLYDEAAGGTFFGEAKPVQDYTSYRETCRLRELTYQPKIQEIVTELIALAPTITSKTQAAQRLATLSEAQMVDQAVRDDSINLRVFRATSMQHILNTRAHLQNGNLYEAQAELALAVKTARTSSCPGGVGGEAESDKADGEASNDDCEFTSKECPLCHKKDVKTVITKTRITGDCGCSAKRS